MAKYHEPIKGAGAERRDELGNFNKAYRKQPHRGSDWGFKTGSQGKPVYAMADGVVADVLWSDAIGHCIITKNSHDHVYIIFAHLAEKPTLKRLERVEGGKTVVGKIGNTGSASAGAHLHAAASLSPKPHMASTPALLDLFKLIGKVKTETPAKKPVSKKAAK